MCASTYGISILTRYNSHQIRIGFDLQAKIPSIDILVSKYEPCYKLDLLCVYVKMDEKWSVQKSNGNGATNTDTRNTIHYHTDTKSKKD